MVTSSLKKTGKEAGRKDSVLAQRIAKKMGREAPENLTPLTVFLDEGLHYTPYQCRKVRALAKLKGNVWNDVTTGECPVLVDLAALDRRLDEVEDP